MSVIAAASSRNGSRRIEALDVRGCFNASACERLHASRRQAEHVQRKADQDHGRAIDQQRRSASRSGRSATAVIGQNRLDDNPVISINAPIGRFAPLPTTSFRRM